MHSCCSLVNFSMYIKWISGRFLIDGRKIMTMKLSGVLDRMYPSARLSTEVIQDLNRWTDGIISLMLNAKKLCQILYDVGEDEEIFSFFFSNFIDKP